MTIPTEPIGSIPRPVRLIEEIARVCGEDPSLDPQQLGTTDDCGFSPLSDDSSTSRETAFEKIRARVFGTTLADRLIGGG
jgi:5-methyltetrahydropteroyltriglutamate--homocysteine methyltransferase